MFVLYFVISLVVKKVEVFKKKGKQVIKWDLNGINRDMVNLDFFDVNGVVEAVVNVQNEMFL